MWNLMFEAKSITDGSVWSPAITLHDRLNVHGFEYLVTGAGTVDIELYTSISGETWINNGVIAKAVGSGSGPGADGGDLIPLIIKPGDLIKFKATATGTVVISGWFTQK